MKYENEIIWMIIAAILLLLSENGKVKGKKGIVNFLFYGALIIFSNAFISLLMG